MSAGLDLCGATRVRWAVVQSEMQTLRHGGLADLRTALGNELGAVDVLPAARPELLLSSVAWWLFVRRGVPARA